MAEGIEDAREQRRREIEAELQLGAIARKLLDDKARERLNNVRLVNRNLYISAVQALVMLAREGRIAGKVGEEELKAVLQNLGEKREIKIRRK